MALKIVLSILVILYLLSLIARAIGRGRDQQLWKIRGKSTKSAYTSYHSTTGHLRPPRIGTTFWFLLAVCVGILYIYWGK